jgi:hypothetical protein
LYLKYRLLDVDLILLVGYLNLCVVEIRRENFGLGFKNFRLPNDKFFDDHLGSYWIFLLFYLLLEDCNHRV